jgi:hypothetical protein
VTQQVAYLDAVNHIHELSATAGGQWADADLTVLTGAPPAADGSPLAGFEWSAGHAKQVVYLDAASHVHELSRTAGGQWADADLTALAGASPAAALSPLAAFEWTALSSKQVLCLDAASHVHELSLAPGGQWADTDLTETASAPPAAEGSQLAGFQWTGGGSKQAVFVDAAGHVHELSLVDGGLWADADLTGAANAPGAAPGSPLSGFEWAAGSTRHIGYIDATGHVNELSWTPGPGWEHTDLTGLTGAPAAAAGSPLAGFGWAAGDSPARQALYTDERGAIRELSVGSTSSQDWNLSTLAGGPAPSPRSPVAGYQWGAGVSQQVAYLGPAGHVCLLTGKLSGTSASSWAETDLTASTGAPAAAGSSPLTGYEWRAGLTELYGELRAELLSRHFALGRYFRADLLCFSNRLGVVHQDGSKTPDTGNDPVHGCLWSPDQAVVQQPVCVYQDADALLALPADQALFERWRVGDHWRINPLMYSGQLMACLAVETALGIPGSRDILLRLLESTRSLFKFTTPPFDGYILRWDPVTSDHWTTVMGENAVWLDRCCDFLTDADQPGGYLYCTPLDDPRYVPYVAQGTYDTWSVSDQLAYYARRRLSLDMTRYWEPSMDELTGLIAGLSFASLIVPDKAIQAEVSDQVGRLARYLSANAYLLVRPGGGFTAQGGTGIAPALEFPFGRVFSRVTGSPHAAQTNFEGALRNAGLWPLFAEAFTVASIGGPLVAPLLSALLLPLAAGSGELLSGIIAAVGGAGTFISLIGGSAILKALALFAGKEAFDVYGWPGSKAAFPASNGQQQEVVVAYLLLQLPSQLRFTGWMTGAGVAGSGYAQNFPPFIGLMGVGDADPTISAAYRGWLTARRAKNDPAPGDDAQDDLSPSGDAFASAVAVLLGAGQPERQKLVTLLWQLAAEFDDKRAGHLGIFDETDNPYSTATTYVTEPVRPALNFIAALALAWHFSRSQAAAGSPVAASAGFPAPPPAGFAMPAATVPAAVIDGSYGSAPAQVIPLSALPPVPAPPPAEVDLFAAGAPRKPANPPAPLTVVRWLFSAPRSHSGFLFPGAGTGVVNAGRMLAGAGSTILGVKLQLVDAQGNPLGDVGTTTVLGRPGAVDGTWPFTAGASIVSDGTGTADETVRVRWWFSIGRACRYRIGYLVQGAGTAL